MSTTTTARLTRPGASTRDGQQSRSGPLLAVWWDRLSLWLARRWQRDDLRHRIDDKRLLDDIGLNREQAQREVAKAFWQ